MVAWRRCPIVNHSRSGSVRGGCLVGAGRLWSAPVGCGRRRRCPIVNRSRSSFLPCTSNCNCSAGQLLYVTFLSLTRSWSWTPSATSAGPSGDRWVILHMLRQRLSPRPIWSGYTTWKFRPQQAVDVLLVVASTLRSGKLWK